MEGSKAYSKDFMRRHNIPTAEYRNFTAYEDAKEYLRKVDYNVVIKASGLAAGQGVIIPTSKEEALVALKDVMVDREFGAAGRLNQCFLATTMPS
jgi:phosphoribosylamine--glycine ligase/phosphoribosylformylglycinamidine cyclo-ligase